MVDCQVRTNDVTDHQLLSALLSVPREEFVDEELRELAYIDRDIKLKDQADDASGRYMISAAPLSKLLQLAAPEPENVALVVGTGTGYACAVLSLLVSSVVGIEEDQALLEMATGNLSRLGFDNAVVLSGEFSAGYEREAPYDVIFVEGAVTQVPDSWLQQLSENGRLVAAIGEGAAAQATLFQKKDGIVGKSEIFNCAVPPLPGFQQEHQFTL